jgi:ankyrin repeat protein
MRRTIIGAIVALAFFAILTKWAFPWAWPTRENRLFAAIWDGNTNAAAKLLAAGANPNASSVMLGRQTPLIDASRFGHVGIVRLLLRCNADVNKGDRSGYSALYYALTSSDLAGSPYNSEGAIIVSDLLARGAKLSGKGVIKAIEELPVDDPRLKPCREALARAGPPIGSQ